MAKQIRWTNQAKADRIGILDYFRKRNGSTAYSKKLNKVFIGEIDNISKHPHLGRKSNSANVRVKVSGNYNILYMIDGETIFILRLWDTRQNPIKLNKNLRPK